MILLCLLVGGTNYFSTPKNGKTDRLSYLLSQAWFNCTWVDVHANNAQQDWKWQSQGSEAGYGLQLGPMHTTWRLRQHSISSCWGREGMWPDSGCLDVWCYWTWLSSWALKACSCGCGRNQARTGHPLQLELVQDLHASTNCVMLNKQVRFDDDIVYPINPKTTSGSSIHFLSTFACPIIWTSN